jgi:hypothetical protein
MLSVDILNIDILSIIILSVVILSVAFFIVLRSVIMLSVLVPLYLDPKNPLKTVISGLLTRFPADQLLPDVEKHARVRVLFAGQDVA